MHSKTPPVREEQQAWFGFVMLKVTTNFFLFKHRTDATRTRASTAPDKNFVAVLRPQGTGNGSSVLKVSIQMIYSILYKKVIIV